MSLPELLRVRTLGHSLPQAFYGEPSIYEAELDAIFHRRWIFAAASCELREPGDFVGFTIGHSPILVLRDQHGTLRACFNTCRHRGSRIVDEPRGRLRALTCPYHRWTYELSGELAYAAHMPTEFDRKEFPLRPVQLREVAGTIYVCLADDPPDFAPYEAALTRQLSPHRLDEAKLAAETEIVERGNWKLVMENSRECYHCATSHRTLVRTLLDIYDFSNPADTQPIGAYWEAWEAAGLPAGIEEGPDFRASRLPFVNGAQSITPDGLPAVRRPLGIAPPDAYGSLRWVHYPTTFNHAHNDYAVLVRMLPLGPQETLLTTRFLVAEDAVEGVDYDVDRLTQVWNQTNLEDRALVERNQIGVNSIGYRPGPYSPTLEAGIVKFVDWYCATMQQHTDQSALA